MNRFKTVWIVVALALLIGPVGAWLGVGVAAQNLGTIRGEVHDLDGNLFPDVTVVIRLEGSAQTFETKTDKRGEFMQVGLRSGIYLLTFKKDQINYEMKVKVSAGDEQQVKVNFKELFGKQAAAAAEAMKKQEEEKKKFENLKAHFDSGVAALMQARTVRGEMQRAPADQRTGLRQKVDELSNTAINEFQAAEKATAENDANRHIVLAKLAESYESAGRFQDAAAAYRRAIELKGDQAGYYNNLGNSLALLGKIEEAGAAFEKSASLDPANAANAWRNFGIVLYNANKLKEAVGPFRKATELDPKYADAWYLLGASLLGAMEYKKEGDKYITVVQPGTAEAYQKYLALAPTGRFAGEAKAALDSLAALGAGIETKMKSRKK